MQLKKSIVNDCMSDMAHNWLITIKKQLFKNLDNEMKLPE